MEDKTLTEIEPTTSFDELARALQEQRDGVRRFLAERRESLDQLQTAMTASARELETDLASRYQGLQHAENQISEDRQDVSRARQTFRHVEDELVHERAQLEVDRVRLSQALNEFEASQKRAGEERADLERALAAAQGEVEQLRRQLLMSANDYRRQDERHQNAQTAGEARIAELTNALDAARASHAAATSAPAVVVDDRRLKELTAERDELARCLANAQAQLADAQGQLADAPEHPATDDRAADLEARLRMTLDDLREAKSRAADLERKLAAAPSGGKVAAPVSAGAMDWESQKRRMLAALEEEEGGDGEEEDVAEQVKQDRLTIEGTISITDAVVAEKDREIVELRQALERAPAAAHRDLAQQAAIADVLDKEQVIQAERERLRELQEKWQGKLREAEIDISVERAKLSRARTELEEKSRVLQAQLPHDADASDSKSAKPKRGRWLSRLGLKNADED